MKYNQWIAHTKSLREGSTEKRVNWTVHSSSHLAMFYARAKQTFLTPNSEYELNLPSNILAPFHMANGSPHPDPAVFTEVAIETQKMLEDSLRRFVSGQLNNVGNHRVLCGIIAGIILCLIGAIPPIAVNFATGQPRWTRLAALPGMWLGLTIIVAALNGICMGVYIFGDLRQLRKFELSRPPISKPQPLRNPHRRPIISLPISSSPPPQTIAPVPPPALIVVPPSPAYILPGSTRSLSLSRTSTMSSSSTSSSATTSSGPSSNGIDATIHISPAYYDADPVEGPATSPITIDTGFTFPPRVPNIVEESHSRASSYTATASFIHPFTIADDESDIERIKCFPEERQPVSDFDFDALPHLPRKPQSVTHGPHFRTTNTHHSSNSPASLLAHLQAKCTLKRWSKSPSLPTHRPTSPSSSFDSSIPKKSEQTLRRRESTETSMSERFKRIRAVPAFASLTRVLSPVIARGQWEIVTRSAVISLVVCWVVLGCLLAVPVVR